MIHLANQILCITNNYRYKEQFRVLISTHNNISILFIHNLTDALLKIQSQRFILIIVDDAISFTNNQLFRQLLSLITSLCINLHTLILVPKLSNEYYSKYIPLGFTYITDIQVVQNMLPAVLRNIEEFQSQKPPSPEKISYKGLTLIPQSNTIYLKGCCISISSVGILILFFLIRHDGYANMCTVQKYLSSMLDKPISESYVTVSMHRLTKRIKNITGLEIVKNRYGVGYYLVL